MGTEANIKKSEGEGTLNGVDMDISDGINENNENNKNNEHPAGEKEETNYDEEKKMVIDSPLESDNKIDQNIETCSSIDNENDIDLDIDLEEQLTPAATESSDIEKTLAGEEHQQELHSSPKNSKIENDVAQTIEKNDEDD